MFRNSYLVKNHKIAKNSKTTIAIEKISTDLQSLEFYINFDVCLTKFKNNPILLNKMRHMPYFIEYNEHTSIVRTRNSE